MRTGVDSLIRVAAMLVVASGFASAQLFIVDARGAGDFVEIQTAIDSVPNGSTLLVRGGEYAGFTIDERSLFIVGDTGAEVSTGQVFIHSVSPAQLVSIANLSTLGQTGLQMTQNLGAVRLQDCNFRGEAGPGALVLNSANVAFTRCETLGATTSSSAYQGLVTDGSRLALYDSTMVGGTGHPSDSGSAGDGSPGYDSGSSRLFASGSTFVGGMGGFGYGFSTFGGDGGPGIRLDGPLARVEMLASTAEGGAGGEGGGFGGNPGSPGPPTDVTAGGELIVLGGAAASLGFSNPVYGYSPISLTVHGCPNDIAYVLVSPSGNYFLFPEITGPLLVGPATGGRILLGQLDGSGALTAPLPIRSPVMGALSTTVLVQPALVNGSGVTLGTVATLTALDCTIPDAGCND